MFQGTLREIADAVGGTVVPVTSGGVVVNGVEFDSRKVIAGQLYVALPGAKTHGHEFVGTVAAAGAVAAIVEDSSVAERAGLPAICVPSSLQALHALAAYWRLKVDVPLLAITGSVGKTTTKELCATVLGALFGKGTYSQASFNNHVGVPYTLLRIAPTDAWAVIEIGMNHRGEIEPLSQMAAPDIVMVTSIAPAHIGNLGSIEAIAEEKLDIVKGLRSSGIQRIPRIVLNGDLPMLRNRTLLDAALIRDSDIWYIGTVDTPTDGAPITATKAAKSSWEISNVRSIGESLSFVLHDRRPHSADVTKNDLQSPSVSIEVPLAGDHHRTNVALAIVGSIALYERVIRQRTPQVQLNLDAVADALRTFVSPDRRFVRRRAAARFGGGEIVDDSYNASPTSLNAFWNATAAMRAGKRWGVVLGEMRELGAFQQQYHEQVVLELLKYQPAFLILVGTAGALDYERAVQHPSVACSTVIKRVDTAADVAAALEGLSFDLLLIKGARGLALERAVADIAQ